jgi:hypothetical protein
MKDTQAVDIGHTFDCLLCSFEPLGSRWAEIDLPQILCHGSMGCIFETNVTLIAAFELNDSNVVANNGVHTGLDNKMLLPADAEALVRRVFQYGVFIDTTQKTIEAGSNDGCNVGWGVVTYDLNFQIK